MQSLSGFPYGEVQFGKQGEIVDRSGFDELLAEAAQGDPPEVFVLSHGWNNDMAEARGLYAGLCEQLRHVLDSSPPAGLGDRRYLVLGVLWPSKKWADRALIPGGAAGVGGAVHDAELVARLDDLRGVFDADGADERIEQAQALVTMLEDKATARDEFVSLVAGLLPESARASADDDDAMPQLFDKPGREVLEALELPVGIAAPVGDAGGRAATLEDGGAAGLSLSLGGIKAAAERLLNLTTYYQMKERAGIVGVTGLNPLLRELRGVRSDLRLHLAGHSFGGRLVTAATAGTFGPERAEPDTVSLLQGAFSHYGFAHRYEGDKDGFFRRVVTEQMTRGPLIITHSKRDVAVGYAYPLVSRLAGQVASALGDAGDRYGGIGRNGAQETPEASDGTLQPVGHEYGFAGRNLYNLGADELIRDHSDIRKPEVAYAMLSAVGATPP